MPEFLLWFDLRDRKSEVFLLLKFFFKDSTIVYIVCSVPFFILVNAWLSLCNCLERRVVFVSVVSFTNYLLFLLIFHLPNFGIHWEFKNTNLFIVERAWFFVIFFLCDLLCNSDSFKLIFHRTDSPEISQTKTYAACDC